MEADEGVEGFCTLLSDWSGRCGIRVGGAVISVAGGLLGADYDFGDCAIVSGAARKVS